MTRSRGKFQGVVQILRFNWPMYAAAVGLLTVGAVAATLIPLPRPLPALILVGLVVAGFWLAASLAAAYYIYDFSPLYRGEWLPPALRQQPERYANLHAGLDEFSDVLQKLFPASDAIVLDFFDPKEMTEPSIERARQEPASGMAAIRADFRSLPLPDEELDAAFLIFAAHELRNPESRLQLFNELRRVLKAEGQIVLVEHLRDAANFLAFGPGFLHFHSRPQWLIGITAAGLSVASEFPLTAFVRAFVLEKATGCV